MRIRSDFFLIAFALTGLVLPAFAGEKSLTVIEVRPAWEKFPPADFGTNAVRLESLPIDAITNLTARHTGMIRASRLAWLGNFARTNLERDGGFKTHVEVGMAYAQNLFYSEALEWMQRALALNQNSSYVYNNLANVYYLSGDIPLALTNYFLALSISRNDPRTLLNLAFIHYETGLPQEAKKFYLKAILIDPALDRPEYQVLAGDEKPPATASPNASPARR
ncbi:MAG: tetratricopeptide repeat protein [Spirochaetes bacterium]|nr:tetratricopeptide repeat protein [Spirochaetota bacterium]